MRVRSRLAAAAGLLCIAAAACQQSEPEREVNRYTIEQFLDTVAINGGSFSHDDKLLLYGSDASGLFNAYTVAVSGGPATQITHSTEDNVFPVSFFPGDNRMLYHGDKGGNEIFHVFLREEDGTVKDLTPGEKNRALFLGWAYDEKSFFYQSNERDPRFMDLYEMDIATFKPALLFQNEGYGIGPVSRDKRYIALGKPTTTSDSDIFLHDRQTNKTRNLTEHEGEVQFLAVDFTPDSKSLYLVTDQDGEFKYLKRMNLESGESEVVEKADWDVMFAGLSREGRYLTVGINNDARTEVRVYDTTTNQQLELPNLPQGDITAVAFSRSEKLMRFVHSGDRTPPNLYVYDPATKQSTRLTDTMNPAINPEDLVDTEVVRYKSFDGLDIPAVLLKPHLGAGEKAPALVEVHGGPGGQSRTGYNAMLQYLVNHGYAVLRVNNRGSSGYGKTFYKMDDMKHGEEDLMDCVEAKKFLAWSGYVEESKIGIIGGSYGGYMVLAALAFQPDAFEVGVDIFGVANWLRTLQNTPPWWAAFRDALFTEMGNPDTDEEYLKRISPLFHAEKIKKPLIVLQGANDPRVLKIESDEIVEKVKANGVPVEYVVFDDEGHGFTKKKNRIQGYEAILRFLDVHLKGEATPAKASD
jgi:dipeptidyl aminopeptidase/acylaminoacyl peptidase